MASARRAAAARPDRHRGRPTPAPPTADPSGAARAAGPTAETTRTTTTAGRRRRRRRRRRGHPEPGDVDDDDDDAGTATATTTGDDDGDDDDGGDDDAGTAAATTTEPPATRHATTRRARSGVSVRTRITAAVALLVTLALPAPALIVYAIESQRIDDQTRDRGRPGVRRVRQAPGRGIDPEHRSAVHDVAAAARALPEPQRPRRRRAPGRLVGRRAPGASSPGRATPLLEDPGSQTRSRPLVATGGIDAIDDRRTARLLIDRQPVRQGDETGALVVVTYLDETRGDLHDDDADLRDRRAALPAPGHRLRRPGSPAGCSRRCARCARPPRRSARPTCPAGSPRPATTTSPR